MFIIKWWRFCRGYLLITIQGRGVERLLNLALARGIGFWDLRKSAAETRLSIDLRSFKALRPLVRQTRCRLRIMQKVGLPFWKWRLRRRWGLVAGALFFCAALYISTALVWQVRVTGAERLDETEILELAGQLGLKPWVWKRSLDLPWLEEELVRLHTEITWAGIRLQGTLVEIEIVERLPEPLIDRRPADLVAAKDGLIIRILALDGEAVVAPGDTVAKGDLLIRGVQVVADPSLPAGRQNRSVPIRARGEVKARVWYEAVAPLNNTIINKIDSGNTRKSHTLRWPDRSLRLFGPAHSPFEHYRRDVVKWFWRWRNITFPVELITVTYYEVLLEEDTISRNEALQRARVEARTELKKLLPEEVEVEQAYYQEFMDQSREWVRAVAETREDIAEIRLAKPESEGR